MLTLIAVAIGFALSVPLSLFVRRYRWSEGLVIGLTSVLYGIPSVALFAVLVPFTGLTRTTVEIGLVTYTLVIFVRNTLAGFDSVPADARDAAVGMGMGSLRILFRSSCRWRCRPSSPASGWPRSRPSRWSRWARWSVSVA